MDFSGAGEAWEVFENSFPAPEKYLYTPFPAPEKYLYALIWRRRGRRSRRSIYIHPMTVFAKSLRLKQCPRTTVHFCLAPDHYCRPNRLAWYPLISVRRWPKPNLNGKPATNVHGSLMAQISFIKLSRSESKNPIYLMCEGAKSARQYFVIIL